MIELKDVSFTYESGETENNLSYINLTIRDGETILLCGESGCGKTTLTRLINGLIPHYYSGKLTGQVLLDGKELKDYPLYQIGQRVGSVFQNPRTQFYNVDTTSEIVFGCENVGMPKKQILSNFENTVKELNISTLLGKSLFSLSGGEKQKIACASVAALFPSIIVMDEPTSNLDMKSISYLKEIIKKWKKSGKTVIIAEHRLYWLMDLADRVIYMDNGYIVQDLLINEFRKYSENDLHQMGLRNSIASENSLYRCNERDTGLTFTDFSFSYKNAPHKALDIEKLSIPKGAIVAVLGNNGAGKTTFGRCLCGLEKRCKGTVILENRELTQKQRIALSYIVMQDVNHQLFTESVIDEILLSMEKQPGTLEEKEKRAMEILHLLKLQEFRECHPMSLSGGQKQRVAIASALGSGKKILVYDEPTSGLDYRHMLDVAEAIREMKKADNTQFIITHDAELVSHCCDYIILMQSGKIIKQGSLMNQDINKAVREFWKQ